MKEPSSLESTVERVMGVDLADKKSAYVVLDDILLDQGDSWGLGLKSRDSFVAELTAVAGWYRPEVILIEDLPHGVKFMKLVKNVCRLQGRIEQSLYATGQRASILWVPPTTWKQHYKLNGKDTAKLIEPKAYELYTYEPPIDYTEFHGKDRIEAKKVRTDYAAAYLMARWAQQTKADTGSYDTGTTARSEVD